MFNSHFDYHSQFSNVKEGRSWSHAKQISNIYCSIIKKQITLKTLSLPDYYLLYGNGANYWKGGSLT